MRGYVFFFFFSSRRRHTRFSRDWSSDVCSSDLPEARIEPACKPAALIRASGLTRRFGSFVAVDDVSFDVARGEIFAFLGPNGAGKTTTIRMLTTLLQPSSGRIELDGLDIVREPTAARRRFGIVFQDSSLDFELTARENMVIHAVLYHVPSAERASRIQHLLPLFALWDRRDEIVKRVSGGMRRRL